MLARGLVDRIGSEQAIGTFEVIGEKVEKVTSHLEDARSALGEILAWVSKAGFSQIDAVGHRVVHGGERFKESTLIDASVEQGIDDCIEFAPLHNPHNLRGIRAARELFGSEIPQVAVFDTAFHQTMPRHAFMYALPYQAYVSYGVRRYGFHGTSHRYVAYRYRTIKGLPKEKVNVITCHLGNGCSMAAISEGKSVDTSMGFTPLEGLVMGTRSGDVDPSILLLAIIREGRTPAQIESWLNKSSGLHGLSGISSDMRTLLAARAKGEDRAALAIDVFCYRVKQYIGRYQAVLGGADALIFTGGIGENSPDIREQSCAGMERLGIEISPTANSEARGERMISVEGTTTPVWVIPTNEELLIARDTARAIEPELQ